MKRKALRGGGGQGEVPRSKASGRMQSSYLYAAALIEGGKREILSKAVDWRVDHRDGLGSEIVWRGDRQIVVNSQKGMGKLAKSFNSHQINHLINLT